MRLARVSVAILLCAWLPPAGRARAETLPLRRYDVSEGLANSRVTAIVQARRGDIWIATWDGVSRYDGYGFTNFTTHDGLPASLISSIAEDRRGDLWFGTFSSGIARLIDDPAARRAGTAGKFAAYHVAPEADADKIGAVAVDARNRLWCATVAGLYRADLNAAGPPAFTAVLPGVDISWPQLLALEPGGRAWAGDGTGVWEIGDGPPRKHALPTGASGDMWNVVAARRGGLWVTLGATLWRFVPGDAARSEVWERVSLPLDAESYIRIVTEDDDGSLWVGTFRGLWQLRDGHVWMFGTEQGLPDEKVRALRVDRDGNLWIGTHNGGLAKLPRGGLVNFTVADGLGDRNVVEVIRAADDRVYAITDRAGVFELSGGRARRLPGSGPHSFPTVILAQDRRENWWIGDSTGLYSGHGPELRFDRLRKMRGSDGLPDPDTLVMGVFRDSDGTVWVGQGPHALTHVVPETDGTFSTSALPLPQPGAEWLARRVLRDRTGTLWVSTYVNLGRVQGGKIVSLAGAPGLPDTEVRALLEDRHGRVWLGHRNRGLSMTSEPAAEHPRFRTWTASDGLSSDIVWALGEDDAGRIYVGTARGLDRLDPDSGRIRHFGPSDGLAGSIVNAILSDDRGRLWVSTNGGISVFDPARDRTASMPPPVYISSVSVSGEAQELPESGTRRVAGLTVPWTRNTMAFSWVGVGFEAGSALRYQTRLDGADTGWSAPSDARSMQYANLGPGLYTFSVRTVSPVGGAGDDVATVQFEILPPFWRRGWFVGLLAVATVGVGYALHEVRVRRLLGLERIRRQIATDLHDDVGSGLAQIAVLSEVAKRSANPEAAGRLEQVAELARGLRDAMGDIVWAVDPRRDHLSDLVRRVRQVAFNLFDAEAVKVSFQAPPDDVLARVELAPDRRRHLFLAAKEALTNAARHAGASGIRVTFAVVRSRLRLEVEDDGCGFDPGTPGDGQGVASLKRRAEALGGTLELQSTAGGGTRLGFDVPLKGELQ